MKVMRKIVEIDDWLCDGCGQCVSACAEGAIEIIDGKARVISEKYCDGLGACLGECPMEALRIVGREAEEFDVEAVEEHLKSSAGDQGRSELTMSWGCKSTQIQGLTASPLSSETEGSVKYTVSALSHWPVQIRLLSPKAPFLKGAHLLVAADCTAVAYPSFHRDFLRGKVIMMGCPRFDKVQAYVRKFIDIFRTAGIKRITVFVMKVRCCQELPVIIRKAMEEAGKNVPIDRVVISTRGKILETKRLAA